MPEEPGHAHGAALAPKAPGCAQPPVSATSHLPHSVPRAATSPAQDQGRPGLQGSEQEGAPRPRGQQGSQLRALARGQGAPGPWAAGSGQALCRRRGQSRAPAVASSEQRWGSCLFLPGRRPGLGRGAEVPWGQEHRLGPHGCPFLFPRDGLSGTPTLAACPSPHHTQAPCLSTDPSVCLSAADLCVHAVPPGLAGGGAPGLPGGV